MLEYDYDYFKRQIFDLTTIDLSAYKERQMKRRIDALITKHGIKTYNDYLAQLKKDKVLYEEFINYLTINVSEFYRNPEQWAILEYEVLPYLVKHSGRSLKIWSAACSTGDEPYSMVMLLSKMIPMNQIHITATDIDMQVLEKAKAGLYSEKSLKALPKPFVDKFFRKIGDTSFEIADEVKRQVEFKKHNLLKDPYPDSCDLIVCRNVLIYFTEEAKAEIFLKFNKALKKGAILFVGSTEQIIQPQVLGYSARKSFFYEKI